MPISISEGFDYLELTKNFSFCRQLSNKLNFVFIEKLWCCCLFTLKLVLYIKTDHFSVKKLFRSGTINTSALISLRDGFMKDGNENEIFYKTYSKTFVSLVCVSS